MDQEDFNSNSDTDDSDFRPQNDNSSSESIEEKYEAYVDAEDNDGENSRKKKRLKKRAKKKNYESPNVSAKQEEEKSVPVDPEKEKKREDDLWAAFLGETESPATTAPAPVNKNLASESAAEKKDKTPQPKAPKESSSKLTQPEIFEFAGEEVIVQESPNILQNSSQNSTVKQGSGLKRSNAGGGGLSSVLNQISKKNKLSVLQKTKMDWDGFKSSEGINEELQTHNRGRDG